MPPEQAMRRVRAVHAAMHVELLQWLRDSARQVNDARRAAMAAAAQAPVDVASAHGGGSGAAPRLPRVSVRDAVRLAHRLMLLPISSGHLASLFSFALPPSMLYLE